MIIYLGSLVQLCHREGETLQTNITGMCGECSRCLGHTGFVPAHSVCAFPVYTAQSPGCSAGELIKWALGCMYFPGLSRSSSGSHIFHKGTDACIFLPFSGSSSLGDQVLGEHTLPRWAVCLITSPVTAAWFPGCAAGMLSQVCCVSALGSLLLTVTLLVDVSHPGSQEDLVSN